MGDSMSLVLPGATSGSVTIDVPAVAGTTSLTLPASTGTLATTSQLPVVGPAFHAYASSNQTIAGNTVVKVNMTAEVFDTANCYDTTNSRFTPNVAGYYFITVAVWFESFNAGPREIAIFKNGSGGAGGNSDYGNAAYQSAHNQQVSNIIYLNGTTDYLEIYTYVGATSGSPTLGSGTARQWFSGYYVRGA